MNASKRIPQLLEAFARLRRERPDARLLLVGAVSPGFDLDRRLQRLGLSGEGIVREAYVEEERLWALMAACDVCVNLRSPTMGETSGSVIRQLSLGKPVVVSDVGWFAELPDDVALKVPVDDDETETLDAALELLARDEGARAAMAAAGARARPRASTTSTASPSSTPPRSSRRQAARRSPTRCSATSRRPRPRSGSRPGSPEASELAPATRRGRAWSIALRRVPAWAWLAGIVAVSFALPRLARAPDAGAVHLRRRAHLLGARAEPRGRRRAPGARTSRSGSSACSTRS